MAKPLDYEVWHDPNRIEGGPWVDVRKKLPDPQFEVILASIAGQYAVGRIFSSVVSGGLCGNIPFKDRIKFGVIGSWIAFKRLYPEEIAANKLGPWHKVSGIDMPTKRKDVLLTNGQNIYGVGHWYHENNGDIVWCGQLVKPAYWAELPEIPTQFLGDELPNDSPRLAPWIEKALCKKEQDDAKKWEGYPNHGRPPEPYHVEIPLDEYEQLKRCGAIPDDSHKLMVQMIATKRENELLKELNIRLQERVLILEKELSK